MDSKEIFAMALHLGDPWYIERIDYRPSIGRTIGQLDIYINFNRGGHFADSAGTKCTAYDTEERTWQHLNFFENKCFLHARVPRIDSPTDGIRTVEVPWARSGSGFTLMFEAFSMFLIESEMPVNRAALTLRVTAPRLWRVLRYWVSLATRKDDLSDVNRLGIDETSTKKGHKYVTIAVDMDRRRVIYATEGKGVDAISKLKARIEEKQCPSGQISNVCMDMSPAFIAGTMKNFPQANITFDKFHIMKMINECMDKVRRNERRKYEDLKGAKYLFLRNSSSLSRAEQSSVCHYINMYDDLGKAYRLKELFNDFWQFADPGDASGYLAYWCDLADESKLKPFIDIVKTIKTHWSGIVNFFKSKLNNGILEGINSKIQLAKKRARGFRNIDNFITVIYLIAGRFKLVYPLYPL
jgi:transposase